MVCNITKMEQAAISKDCPHPPTTAWYCSYVYLLFANLLMHWSLILSCRNQWSDFLWQKLQHTYFSPSTTHVLLWAHYCLLALALYHNYLSNTPHLPPLLWVDTNKTCQIWYVDYTPLPVIIYFIFIVYLPSQIWLSPTAAWQFNRLYLLMQILWVNNVCKTICKIKCQVVNVIQESYN